LDLRVVRLQPATNRHAKAQIVPPLGMKRTRAAMNRSLCSRVGGIGHKVSAKCVSVRSSSNRCQSFVSSRQTASKQRGTRRADIAAAICV
jgi:hypothetical protein